MNSVVVGINWGDEGKGRMVDLLAENYDVVVRYQGGNNAGHTVVNPAGKFILNLLPSGILRPEVINVMGNGMVIDIRHLVEEIARLREKGVKITPENLKISDKAVICMPYHVEQDCLEEARLADKKYGSTKRGIAPVYADKYLKKTMRMGDLLHNERLLEKIRDITEWKNLMFMGYKGSVDTKAVIDWLNTYGSQVMPFVCDTGKVLSDAEKHGKSILFEAQLGALRDIDFGIYPYTSSSNTLAAYAGIGSGAPWIRLNRIIGIVKAYSSCVGEGWFVTEMFGEEADALRKAGGEYGAATGRPRRVGAFDVPATRYGVQVQGATEIALTKLDVLSYMEEIPVCVAYNYSGKLIEYFPYPECLTYCRPEYKYVKGWKTDISGCRKFDQLPSEAKDYVRLVEDAVRCKIKYVSVGAGREEIIEM